MTELLRPNTLTPNAGLPEVIDVPDTTIRLRHFTADDAPWLAKFAQDEAVNEYIPWAPAAVTDELAEAIIDKWQHGPAARYGIEVDGQLGGYFGVMLGSQTDVYTTGSALLPQHRGKGIVNAAYFAVERLLRDTLHARGVESQVDPKNFASRKMIERRGFRLLPADDNDLSDVCDYIKLFR